jgi:hypothetical protein
VRKLRYVTRLFGQIIQKYLHQHTIENGEKVTYKVEVDEEEEMNKFIVE